MKIPSRDIVPEPDFGHDNPCNDGNGVPNGSCIEHCCPDCAGTGPVFPIGNPIRCSPRVQGAIYMDWRAVVYDSPLCIPWAPGTCPSPICADVKINTFECLGSRSVAQAGELSLESFELDVLFRLNMPQTELADALPYWAGPKFLINGLILRKGWNDGPTPDYRIFTQELPGRERSYPFPNANDSGQRYLNRIGPSTSSDPNTSHLPLRDSGGFYNPNVDSGGLNVNKYTIPGNSFGSAFSESPEPDFQIAIWVDMVQQPLTQTTTYEDEFKYARPKTNEAHWYGSFKQKSIFTTTGVVDLVGDGGSHGGLIDGRQYKGYCDPSLGWNGTTRSAVPPIGTLRLDLSSDIESFLPIARRSRESETVRGSSAANIQFIKDYHQIHYNVNPLAPLEDTTIMGLKSFDAFVWTGRHATWTPPSN